MDLDKTVQAGISAFGYNVRHPNLMENQRIYHVQVKNKSTYYMKLYFWLAIVLINSIYIIKRRNPITQAKLYHADGCYDMHELIYDEKINFGAELWYYDLMISDSFQKFWNNFTYWDYKHHRWPWGYNATEDGFYDPTTFRWEAHSVLPIEFFH